jgi:tetraacyldisaccharide 4'-kinase
MKTIRYLENKFIIFLSLVLRTVAFPFLLLYFLRRIARDRNWRRKLAERFGGLPASFSRTPPGAVWLHAVSVGEVLSAIELLKQLRAAQPYAPLYVSTTTLAGRAVAEEKLRGLAAGVFYLPIDYGFAIRRVLRAIRPNVLVVLETELWPVLFRTVTRAGCALLIVNGRISDRAWPRYRRLRWFFRRVLEYPRLIAVQSEADRQRYLMLARCKSVVRPLADARGSAGSTLGPAATVTEGTCHGLPGGPESKIVVFGNLKYDAAPATAPPPEAIRRLLEAVQPEGVWIAASTTAAAEPGDVDEDDAVIATFRQLAPDCPRLLLILVPRKPERFAVAAAKLAADGVPFLKRSELRPDSTLPLPGVLLLDTLGELNGIFPLADVVFMGGTLARRGGHNILEPAAAGKPVVMGPHMENFAAIAAEFRAADAVVDIPGPSDLAAAVRDLLRDPSRRDSLGSRAQELALAKRGTTARAVRAIVEARDLAVPRFEGRGPAYPVLAPLALLWKAGNRWNERRDFAHARSLGTPVISVGGIGMGGAGKTPTALLLARRFSAAGLRPAILTRGYGRKSSSRAVVVPAGRRVSVDQTGDEAQIFVQEGWADTGISADRFEAGRMLEALTRPDVFILDDGFQHRRLKRDCDIVLIDALDPFAGGALFPAGRLREPLTALARADAFLITRAEPDREYRGIRQVLARYNPDAPVFHSRAQPSGWIDHASGRPAGITPRPAIAFCGIGNPHSFWQTLRDLGIEPAFAWAFDDHHSYTTRELQRLAAQASGHGAPALLTTRKDSFNLPPNAAELVAPAAILWLDIEAQVFEEEELIRFVHKMSV